MTIKGRLFLLDDDELISSMLTRSLKKAGYEVQSETSTDDVINKIAAWYPDLILLDIHLDEDKSGLAILEELKREEIPGQVVMLTADDSAESAITAMKLGAADYLTKPFNMDEVKLVIGNIIEKERLREEVDYLRKAKTAEHEAEMIGESPAIKELRDKGKKLAEAKVRIVLITGESGTGKEVAARYIYNHLHWDRNGEYAPFIAVNCTALPEQLFESELFGHVKGAFTDAKSDKKGMFELANGGTILLFHRREVRQEGNVRTGERWNDPAGRDRRHADEPPEQAAAGSRRPIGAAPRRKDGPSDRRNRDRHDEYEPRRSVGHREIPDRPVLPVEYISPAHPAAA